MPIFGAKSRAVRGCASKLACGRRIGPMRSYEFSENYRKNALPLRRLVIWVGEIGRHTGVVFDGVRVDALYGAPFEKRFAEERVQVLHGAVEIDLLVADKEDRVHAAAREQAPLAPDLAVAELFFAVTPRLIQKTLVVKVDDDRKISTQQNHAEDHRHDCLLYTSDAADE